MNDPYARLARVRRYRVRPERDLSLFEPASKLAHSLERRRKATGGIAEVWSAVAPDSVRTGVVIVGIKRGVLTLRCSAGAKKYALSRWLASGGERSLIDAARERRVGISRVRVIV